MHFLDVILNQDGKGYYLEINGDHLYIPAKKEKEILNQYLGKSVKMGIRPEDIYDDDLFLGSNPDSVIETTVDVSELMGSEVYLYLNYGSSALTARVAPTTESRSGDNIKVGLNMNKIHLFDAETEEAILN